MRTMSYVRWFMCVFFLALCAVAPSFAQVSVAVTIAPPDLPVYDQPVCPGENYIWTPGYWAWDGEEYYWVPGTWVEAPEPGYFWTPAYWAWNGSGFVFYDGYWATEVGFYGGVDYGFGYFGHGYVGGRWDNGHFFYNRAVSNVNVTIVHNVYEQNVNNTTVTRVSYNGGNGGINARPTSQEEAAAGVRHIPPTAAQTQHIQAARSDKELRASVNHGKPSIAATPKPGAFKDHVVAAREAGTVHAAPAAGEHGAPAGGERTANEERPSPRENATNNNHPVVHPNDIPPAAKPAPPNTGNAKLDQKYEQQQQKLQAKQEQERQKLQQKQDNEHQQFAKKNGGDAQRQQMEQRHQQQTQQLAQKQTQERQKLQEKQQPPEHTAQKQDKKEDEKR
jgi:hypothetical protein